ncbi:hypothetical protein THIOKS1550013 [Thiocapsa sp. KS1]|nr:hypothetical protein THIOKS1550013 [Thiocapsa sp. KS1]
MNRVDCGRYWTREGRNLAGRMLVAPDAVQ